MLYITDGNLCHHKEKIKLNGKSVIPKSTTLNKEIINKNALNMMKRKVKS